MLLHFHSHFHGCSGRWLTLAGVDIYSYLLQVYLQIVVEFVAFLLREDSSFAAGNLAHSILDTHSSLLHIDHSDLDIVVGFHRHTLLVGVGRSSVLSFSIEEVLEEA